MASIPDHSRKLPDFPASWMALSTLLILGVVGLFVLMMLRPDVLLILFAGIFLGIAIKPAVDWLARRGLPEEVGATLLFIAILALLGVFIGLVLPLLASQTVNLSAALSEGYNQIRLSLVSVPNLLVRQIVQMLPEDFTLLQPMLTQSVENGVEGGLDGVGLIVGQVFGAGLSVIFVFFLAVNWAVEGDRFVRTVLLLSSQRREFLRDLFLHIENRISRYLAGVGALSLVVGVLALIGYLIIGLPYAVVLAVFAGLMEAVPMIGPALGAVPAVAVALSISPAAAIAVIVLSVLIQAAENVWIFPKVMGTSMGVPPFVTLIAMLAFSTLFGIAGAFIAIPVAAVIQVFLETIIEHRQGQTGDEIGRDRVSAVRYEIKELVEDIRLQAREKKTGALDELQDMEDTLEEIALDLDELLKQSAAGETA